jgi:hypothetical protein
MNPVGQPNNAKPQTHLRRTHESAQNPLKDIDGKNF